MAKRKTRKQRNPPAFLPRPVFTIVPSDHGDQVVGVKLNWGHRLPTKTGPFPKKIVEKVMAAEVACDGDTAAGLERLHHLSITLQADPFLYKFNTNIREEIYNQTYWGAVRSFFLLFGDMVFLGNTDSRLWDARWNEIAGFIFAYHCGDCGVGMMGELAGVQSGNPMTGSFEQKLDWNEPLPTIGEQVDAWASPRLKKVKKPIRKKAKKRTRRKKARA